MSLWGKSVTRHYTHEYPALAGKALAALMALQPGEGVSATSRRQGLRVGIKRLYPAGDAPCFCVSLINGQQQTIRLESTRTAFNGLRWWYACPHCFRRCGALYWTQSAIACRQCLNLHYACQSETPKDRELRRLRAGRYAIGAKMSRISIIYFVYRTATESQKECTGKPLRRSAGSSCYGKTTTCSGCWWY